MRILVQSRETLQYYKTLGEWTSEAEEAMDFVSSTAAERICKEHALTNVRMVIKFDRPGTSDLLLHFLSDDTGARARGKV